MAARKKKKSAPGKKKPRTKAKQKKEKPSSPAAKEMQPEPKAEEEPVKGELPPDVHRVMPKEDEKLAISDDSILTLSELSKPLGEKETMADIAPKKQEASEPAEPPIEAKGSEASPAEEPQKEAKPKKKPKPKKAESPEEGEPEDILTDEQLAVLEGAPKPTQAAEVGKAFEPERKPLPPPPAPPKVPSSIEKPKAPPVLKRLKEKVGLEPAPETEEEEALEVKPTEVAKTLPVGEKPMLEAVKDAVLGVVKHKPEEKSVKKVKLKKKPEEELPPPLPVGEPEEKLSETKESKVDKKRHAKLKQEVERELRKIVKEKGYVSEKKAKALKYEIAELERKLKITKGEPVPEPVKVEAPPKTLLETVVDLIKHEPTSAELEEQEKLREEARKRAKKLIKEREYIKTEEADILEDKAAELKEKLRVAEEKSQNKLKAEGEKLRQAEEESQAKLKAKEEKRRQAHSAAAQG